MIDHHHDEHRGKHPGMPPLASPALPRAIAGAVPHGDPPHFWKDGPSSVRAIPPRRVRTRGGAYVTCTWEQRWYLDKVSGTTTQKAIQRLYDVLLRPDGWIRTGIHFKRVTALENATMIVRVIPANETVCGKGSLGCYSYGYHPSGKPMAENGVEIIDQDGPWNIVVGMEVCGHGAVKMEDMYTPDHQPYLGSMGNWESCAKVGYKPTQAEIDGARAWLAKTLDASRVHH